MRGQEIINRTSKLIKESVEEDGGEQVSNILTSTLIQMLEIHSRALICHCECLSMNAENCAAACIGGTAPYNDSHYYQAMQKWGLVNEKGEPLI